MIKSSNNGMFQIPTMPAAGTTVAQSASANTFGSYVAMTTATSEADYVVAVRVSLASVTSQPTYVAVNVGTGGVGSETTVGIVNIPTIGANGTPANGAGDAMISGRVEFPYPIPVANATRIAVKTASDIGSALSWKVWLDCYKQADLVDAGVNEQANVIQWNSQTAQTDANNLPKVDVEDIVGAAVSTTTAQLGVNVVKYNNQTAATDANNLPKVDVEDWKANAVPATNQNGVPIVDVKYWLGTIVTAATAGVPDVNVKNYNNQGALTDSNSNLPKVDVEDWKNATAPAFPTNFAALGISAGGHVSNVDTLTTYTGNTPQTGDIYGKLIVRSSTFASTASGNQITLDAGASSTDNAYLGMQLRHDADSTTRTITNYIGGSTRQATVDGTSPTTWTSGDNYTIFQDHTARLDLNVRSDIGAWNGSAVSAANAGVPNVNAYQYNGQTTQTDANNLPKVDVEDIRGQVATVAGVSRAALGR